MGPGGICANGIGHGPKRDDVWSTARVSARTIVVEYRLQRHPEGGSPTGGKCNLLRGRYPGGYGGEQYSNARAEGKHCPGGYDQLDRVGRTESNNCEDGRGAVYTLLSVQSPFLPPKGGADKALYDHKVFGVVVRR